MTEYRLVGGLEEILKAIAGLFLQYHPNGYGTSVHSIHMGADGQYVARVSRSNSCD